jgi:hypothetical protein
MPKNCYSFRIGSFLFFKWESKYNVPALGHDFRLGKHVGKCVLATNKLVVMYTCNL